MKLLFLGCFVLFVLPLSLISIKPLSSKPDTNKSTKPDVTFDFKGIEERKKEVIMTLAINSIIWIVIGITFQFVIKNEKLLSSNITGIVILVSGVISYIVLKKNNNS